MSEASDLPQNPADEPSALESRAKSLFDESVANLDGTTRSKLAQARSAAVELAERRTQAATRWRLWVPAGSAAAAVLAVLIIFASGRQPPAPQAIAFDDMEIVANDDEFDLLENVEFYSWLDTQPVDSAAQDGEVG